MKRYRDCIIECRNNQEVIELLNIIEVESRKSVAKVERYNSFSESDSLAIYVEYDGLPYSKVVICTLLHKTAVSIANIVPMPQSGVSHIEPVIYNQILEKFILEILQPIQDKTSYVVTTNKEDYTIQEIIPKSFPLLHQWISAYPLSCHQFDTHRWFEFIISLHKNQEELSLETFGSYLKEECQWQDDIIDNLELKLGYSLDLLGYYDEH